MQKLGEFVMKGDTSCLGFYFGEYLLEKAKLSQMQLEEIFKQQESPRVKLGLIAVAEKLLTDKQAEEPNELQNERIAAGDIVIEKGYLVKRRS